MTIQEPNEPLPDADYRPPDEVVRLITEQFGGETFERLDVVVNPRYPAPIEPAPYPVVPFQVCGFNHKRTFAGIAPTGRNLVAEGIAIQGADGEWEIYADSIKVLCDLGVQVAVRPPAPPDPINSGAGQDESSGAVPSTAALGEDQDSAVDGG